MRSMMMKTMNNIPDGFSVKPFDFHGETLYLINPLIEKNNSKWTETEWKFRSSIWNEYGDCVSAGFPKFFNWGQFPEDYPTPKKLNECTVVEKLDGSLLIVSQYKGELIIRTRGSTDISHMNNYSEMEYLITEYPKAFDNQLLESEQYSLLYEWLSPENQIVIKHNQPDIVLVGIIDHKDYSLFTQENLDVVAKNLKLKRPQNFSFGNFVELFQIVKEFKDKEGVCIYFDDGQHIRKFKGEWYLVQHHFRSNLTSKNMLDLFYLLKKPTKSEFLDYIEKTFDYECRVVSEDIVTRIIKKYTALITWYAQLNVVIAEYQEKSQKEFALAIQDFASIDKKVLFMLRSGKGIEEKFEQKLMLTLLG